MQRASVGVDDRHSRRCGQRFARRRFGPPIAPDHQFLIDCRRLRIQSRRRPPQFRLERCRRNRSQHLWHAISLRQNLGCVPAKMQHHRIRTQPSRCACQGKCRRHSTFWFQPRCGTKCSQPIGRPLLQADNHHALLRVVRAYHRQNPAPFRPSPAGVPPTRDATKPSMSSACRLAAFRAATAENIAPANR